MDLNKIYELANIAERTPPFTNNGMFPPSAYYRFLYQLAVYKQPQLSVVLGVCGGGCCFNLLQGSKGKVVGVDLTMAEYEKNLTFLQQDENFTFWKGDSVDSANDICRIFGMVDILFIDTVHTFDRTIKEFITWLPYLRRNAIVLLDDLYREGMEEAWQYLTQRYGIGLRLDNLHIGGSPTDGGFGVICNIKQVK